MKLYNNLSDLPVFKNAVVTIGSFDGVHKGHQKIISKVNEVAREIGGESVLITFHPHPRIFLFPDNHNVKLITNIHEKVRLIEKYEIDHVVVVPFNKEFAGQSAEAYIEDFLIDKFHPACIVIGYDHRFGKGRKGDLDMMKTYASKGIFKLIEIEKQEVEALAISSTRIREAIEKGSIEAATHFMNHPFYINGTVVHGQKIGQTIGFPTANVKVAGAHKIIPPYGIYATYVYHQGQQYQAMLYIGDRPSLDDGNHQTIEVNIFDFNKDIYGDQLEIEFVKFIREDMKFESLEALQNQIALDKEASLKVFKYHNRPKIEETNKEIGPSVAVIILNYNGREHLEQFLPSVIESTYPNFKIHVADNGSTDESIPFLQNKYPEIEIHNLELNHGFAKGYNEAVKFVDADYFVLLNSDVEVTKDWISPIIDLMEKDKTIGACQPKVNAYLDRIKFEHAGAAGGWVDYLGYPFCRGRIFDFIETDKGQYDHVEEVFWATGAAMFIRPELYRNLGGFDPDYFAHMEEIDLCWRIKRAGFKIMAQPKSQVYHLGGGTLQYENPRKTYLNFRNTLYTILKNEPKSKLTWLIPARLVLDGLAGFKFLLQGKWKHTKSIIQAHFTFYRNFRKMRAKVIEDTDRINKISIQQVPNMAGVYPRSIVWQYYIKAKKHFSNLKF